MKKLAGIAAQYIANAVRPRHRGHLAPVALATLVISLPACRGEDQATHQENREADNIATDAPTPSLFVGDPIDSETGLEESCQFLKSNHHPDPQLLVREFAARAAAGRFSQAEDWLPTALDCIGHEPGYDTFSVVTNYSTTMVVSRGDTTWFELDRSVIGYYTGGAFYSRPRAAHDTIAAYRTDWGSRIRSPAPWNWVLADSAIARGWFTAADTAGQ